MFPQAKWFGLSLVLHLTAVGGLIFVATHTIERAPKAIMVVLDNVAMPDLPRRSTTPAASRLPAPAALPHQAQPEAPRQVLQQAVPEVPPTIAAPEPKRVSDLPKTAPEVPAAAAIRPKAEPAGPAPPAQAKIAVQHSAPTETERSTPEQASKHYLKEHFAYIRDLITKQLAYPSMARKMRWSGKVVVAFVIAEDGTVHNIRVLETSGFTILDKCATDTVRNAAPFPKPPVRAEIVVPINFKML